jgi:prepilin-type N-terminal cleavage/methylation domain-containing protein/prepilin-type processing-associated H-X9-DG protein
MKHRRPAFTLVELLVVIGIIALLISILLPSLSKARASARTVACSANIRSICQGMIQYSSENKGYFPGGANSSGAFLLKGSTFNDNNCPDVIQTWDWMSPIAKIQGVSFETGPTVAERTSRFKRLLDFPGFKCPENDLLAQPFSTPNAGVVPLNSYVTAAVFHYKHNPSRNAGDGNLVARGDYNPPPGYSPQISNVGSAARKIFIADGARYSRRDIAPDYDFGYDGGYGGAFSDVGAWSSFSNSWDRAHAPGNSGGGSDARVYAYRHGQRKAKGNADSYRFNAGFFDGHVETLGDLDGANPELWMPKGTEVPNTSSQCYKDVRDKYFSGTSGAWFAP